LIQRIAECRELLRRQEKAEWRKLEIREECREQLIEQATAYNGKLAAGNSRREH
jgi:hypothetical protein